MPPAASIIILFLLLIFCSSNLPLLENIWAALRMLLLADSMSPSLFWFCSIDPMLLRITFAVLSIVFFAWYILSSGVPYVSQSNLIIRSMSALFTVEDGLFRSSGALFDRSECRLLNMCDAEPSLSSVSASITMNCIFTILLTIKQQTVCMWVYRQAAWTSFRTSLTVSSSSHPWYLTMRWSLVYLGSALLCSSRGWRTTQLWTELTVKYSSDSVFVTRSHRRCCWFRLTDYCVKDHWVLLHY